MKMTFCDRPLPVVLILCRDRRIGRGLVLLAQDSGFDAVWMPSAAGTGDHVTHLPDGRTAAFLWADADDLPELNRLPDGFPAVLWTDKAVTYLPTEGCLPGQTPAYPMLLHRPFDEERLILLTRARLSETGAPHTAAPVETPAADAPSAPLTPNEQKILDCLTARRGIPVPRAELRRLIGEAPDAPGNMVDVYVSRLRGKLEKPTDARMIVTVRGVGYMMK